MWPYGVYTKRPHSCPIPAFRAFAAVLLTGAMLAVTAGCQTQLIATPNVYLNADDGPFDQVSPEYRHNRVDVLYITDRVAETRNGKLAYGYGRSDSVAVGSCIVEFGKNVPWETLVHDSLAKRRHTQLPVTIRSVEETHRFPPSPPPLTEVDGKVVKDPQVIAEREEKMRSVHQELSRRLALSPRKDVYLYVHGFNNSFEHATGVIAQIWHFLGRQGIPVAYTWPAGHGTNVRGYNYDRESGEFTIFHLKETLLALAACPDVETVHVIAHSRGTDIALSALRELHIAMVAAGKDSQVELKLGNVVIAAADMDLRVMRQRIGAEGMSGMAKRILFYVSPKDRAIGFSTWLFGSTARVGQVKESELEVSQRHNLTMTPNVQVIWADVDTGFLGHSYFYQNPAVISDLILALRYDLDPGDEGRPLRHPDGSAFWMVTKGYPNPTGN